MKAAASIAGFGEVDDLSCNTLSMTSVGAEYGPDTNQ
jgi:hypothetical protein